MTKQLLSLEDAAAWAEISMCVGERRYGYVSASRIVLNIWVCNCVSASGLGTWCVSVWVCLNVWEPMCLCVLGPTLWPCSVYTSSLPLLICSHKCLPPSPHTHTLLSHSSKAELKPQTFLPLPISFLAPGGPSSPWRSCSSPFTFTRTARQEMRPP